MIKRFILFTFLSMPLFLTAQTNLVPNPGFEIYSTCPQYPPDGNIDRAFPWFQPWNNYNSSDFYNSCDTVDQNMSVPFNFLGFQYPHSGNGYSGILCYYQPSPNNGREYLEIELSSPLLFGNTYDISFYANSANFSQFAVDNFGIAFSDSIILFALQSTALINMNCVLCSSVIVDDTLNWTHISGKYVAQGGEKFMLVGNFKPDSLISNIATGFGIYPGAYYYFDDFNVSLDSTTSLEELNNDDIVISPNPSTDVFTVSTKNGFLLNGKVEAFNLEGQLFMSQDVISEQNFTIDLKNFASGVYLLKMKLGDRIVVRKLVKM